MDPMEPSSSSGAHAAVTQIDVEIGWSCVSDEYMARIAQEDEFEQEYVRRQQKMEIMQLDQAEQELTTR